MKKLVFKIFCFSFLFIVLGVGLSLTGNVRGNVNYALNTNSNFVSAFADSTATEYIVTLNCNGGTISGKESYSLSLSNDNSSYINNYVPVRNRYLFKGWFKDASLTKEWDHKKDVLSSNITLYAKWEQNIFTVTLELNGGYLFGNKTIDCEKGKRIERPANTPTKTDYIFLGWYTDSACTTLFDFNTRINSDITLYAGFIEAVNIKIYSNLVTYGNTITKPINSKISDIKNDILNLGNNCYSIYGVYKDENFTQEILSTEEFKDDITIYVKFVSVKVMAGFETLLNQQFNYNTLPIIFEIEVRKGQRVEFLTNYSGGPLKTVVAQEDGFVKWTYIPERLGSTLIWCNVDGVSAKGAETQSVVMTPSIPYDLVISVDKVVNKKTFKIFVEDGKFYNSANFVWFRTTDKFSDDFTQQISDKRTSISQKFETDCKIKVMYIENGEIIAESNVIDISVDNYFDVEAVIATVITLIVVAVIFVVLIITFRKYKNFF